MVDPALHSPYIVMRATGVLSKWGVGSFAQFYILALSIEFNGTSVSEMSYFRYKSSIMNYKDYNFTYFLKFCVYSTRFIALFDVVFIFASYNYGFQLQQEYKSELLKQNPSDTFLTCSTLYFQAAFTDYVSSTILAFWIIQSVILFMSVPGTAVFISYNMPKTISEVTLKVQHQLLRSLIVQASIHGIMLGIPNTMFIYGFVFGYHNETIAYGAIACLVYHGFASSFAMIIFTKPLRQYLLASFKLKKSVNAKVSVTSYKRPSVIS